MTRTWTGTLRGNVITLDTVAFPERGDEEATETQRVRVVLEPLDDSDLVLSDEQQARLLATWAEQGPQGPLEEEEVWSSPT